MSLIQFTSLCEIFSRVMSYNPPLILVSCERDSTITNVHLLIGPSVCLSVTKNQNPKQFRINHSNSPCYHNPKHTHYHPVHHHNHDHLFHSCNSNLKNIVVVFSYTPFAPYSKIFINGLSHQ